jgi:hypothetical protein
VVEHHIIVVGSLLVLLVGIKVAAGNHIKVVDHYRQQRW